MKKLIITLFLAFAMLGVIAQNAWTVDMVPNTRLQSNFIHVSDPDNYLSAQTEMKINTALSAIRDTADVFLVCLSSIGYEEPANFRTKLFNKWGIGDKEKNNGLLLLFVEDVHAFEFETGYGIEPILPDIKCFEIFNHTIKPYFKEGDYEGGMYAGVLDIVEVFGGTVSETLITDLPDEEVYKSAVEARDLETISNFALIVMALFGAIALISSVRCAKSFIEDKKSKNKGEIKDTFSIEEKDGLRYLNEPSTTWTGSAWQGAGCAKFFAFGFSALAWMFVITSVIMALMPAPEQEYAARNWIAVATIFCYFTWICFKHNRRTLKMANKVAQTSLRPKKVYEKAEKYVRTQFVNYTAYWLGRHYIKKYEALKAQCVDMLCPDCRQPMTEDDTVQLPAMEAAEQSHNVYKFTSLRCPSGHAYVMKEQGKGFNAYETCEKCGAHLMGFVNSTVLTKATYSHSGLKSSEYECEFCHNKSVRKIILPKLERSSSSSSGGSSSGGSSGGSFGGGSSGGGGYSGRW